MLFHPKYFPAVPLTTLERTTPVKSPLMICPIFFPLTRSSDSFAQSGSSSCGITEVTPTARQAIQANIKLGDRYIPKSDRTDKKIIVKINLFRSVKSAMGRIKKQTQSISCLCKNRKQACLRTCYIKMLCCTV